jgi:uncharacterized protein (DUF1778 family)
MRTSTKTKSDRIELRAMPEIKHLIERAAQLAHTTVSAYLLDAALQKAKDDLKESETLVLSETDREAFFSALANPPKPNAALKGLFQD